MRIVYVLTSLGMGGAERQVLAIAARMADRGHSVALLVLRPQLKNEWPTALSCVHLDMRRNPLRFIYGLARGRRFLREFRPDLVHSHSFHANFVARLLKVLVPAPAVLCTVHNVYEGGRHRMLAYRLTDFLSRRTTAVSAVAAERFVRLKAVPQSKCLVVTNGIDTAEFFPHADRRAQMRDQMGVTTEFIWLTAGRIVPAKDFPNLMRAFEIVQAAHPDAQLWIAGQAVNEDLKPVGVFAVAGRKDTMDRVRWLGLRRDLPALLDAADGFVLASAWEGMPLVLGEAMAMEKPVVATDVGGVRELVGDTGAIVPPKNPDALAAAMLEMMQRTEVDRRAQGRAARARIEADFTVDARTDEWESLYLRLSRRA
jgi:glycosyltransferase involved in cell wall biosynthesis